MQDDLGVEGVIIIENPNVKKVRLGSKVSSSQIKREEHVDGKDAQSFHLKNLEATKMETNTKDLSMELIQPMLGNMFDGRG